MMSLSCVRLLRLCWMGIMPGLSQGNETRQECMLIDGDLIPHSALPACHAYATRVLEGELS